VHIAVPVRALTRGRPRSVERHLSPAELDATIRRARSAGAARLVQRGCFVKNCDVGDDAGERERLQGRLGTDGPVTTAGVGGLLGVEYAAGYLPRLLRAQGCPSRDPERVDLPPDASTAGRPSSDSSKMNSFSNLS
jgi:hypothetical protein